MKNTKIINFFGGPCSGKSTISSLVFYNLKSMHLECELVTEYAKDLVWEESFKKLKNQIYVFGKQHNRIWKLLDKVDYIVTDSSILNSIIYDLDNNEKLQELIIYEFNKLNNLNFFLNRKFNYNSKGRIQTEEESIQLDNKIKETLNNNKIDFVEVYSDDVEKIMEYIMGHAN